MQGTEALRSICGLPLSNYFSAVKLRWMIDNVPEVKEAYEDNRLQFGTVDTWLIYVSDVVFYLCYFVLFTVTLK